MGLAGVGSSPIDFWYDVCDSKVPEFSRITPLYPPVSLMCMWPQCSMSGTLSITSQSCGSGAIGVFPNIGQRCLPFINSIIALCGFVWSIGIAAITSLRLSPW